MSPGQATTPRRGALAAAAVILAFVLAYIATGYLTLDPASRMVPLLAGAVTVALLLAELARLGRGPAASPASGGSSRAAMPKEWRVLASVIALVGGIYLVGFIIALPLYLTFAIWLLGSKPLRVAVATAVAATGGIYTVFVLLLSIRLYAGVFFGA